MTSVNVEVNRNSGAVLNLGSFGKADRFSDKVKVGHGVHSPMAAAFYSRSQLWKMPHEVGKNCTQGYGERSETREPTCTGSVVGPGSYKLVPSVCTTKSALDGSEFCSTTLKARLPSMLAPASMASPGPHAKYEVRKKADHFFPSYNKEKLSHGSRHPISQDEDGPGPGAYDQHIATIAASISCPNFRTQKGSPTDGLEAARAGGTKRHVLSTFGEAKRFPSAKTTCSPDKNLYYAHNKGTSDYSTVARSCTLGRGTKTDFSNLMRLSASSRSQVSPVTYYPEISQAKPTSTLDGSASRCASPISAACREMASRKHIGSLRRRKFTQQGASQCMPRSFDAEGAGAGADGGVASGGGGGGDGAAAAAAEGSA